MTTRAKFRVDAIERTANHGPDQAIPELWTVKLAPVYSSDPTHENHTFWQASPNGRIELGCTKPHESVFRLGQEVYVDFTPA